MQPHSLESSMSERDEMRRLIDVIEKSAASASVQQNAEDLKLFANTASYIANKLDAKLRATKTGVSETLCMRFSPCGLDGSFIEPFWV